LKTDLHKRSLAHDVLDYGIRGPKVESDRLFAKRGAAGVHGQMYEFGMGGSGGRYHEGVYPRPEQCGWGLSEVRAELSRKLGCPAEVGVSYRQPVNQLVIFQGAAMKTPDSASADQSDVQWLGGPFLGIGNVPDSMCGKVV